MTNHLLILGIVMFATGCATGFKPTPEQQSNYAFVKWNNNPMIPGMRGISVEAVDGETNGVFTTKLWLAPGKHSFDYKCYDLYNKNRLSLDGQAHGHGRLEDVYLKPGKKYFVQCEWTSRHHRSWECPANPNTANGKAHLKHYGKESYHPGMTNIVFMDWDDATAASPNFFFGRSKPWE